MGTRGSFLTKIGRIFKNESHHPTQLTETSKTNIITWGFSGRAHSRMAKVTDLQFIGSGSNPPSSFSVVDTPAELVLLVRFRHIGVQRELS